MQSITRLLIVCTAAFAFGGKDTTLELSGLPLQMEWVDIDGNGQLDLVALMIETKTEGNMDTWMEGGALRGMYADQTTREKYLATWLQENGSWTKTHHIPLDRTGVLGFALSKTELGTYLMLWQNTALLRHRWQNSAWELERSLGTPGLLAEEAASLADFPFWFEDAQDAFWMVPDFGGIHVWSINTDSRHMLAYPEATFEKSKLSDLGHRIEMPLPRLKMIDGDARPELTFLDDGDLLGYTLGESIPAFQTEVEGMLTDLNGDGMLDLLMAEETDIDRLKDLPKVKTHIRTYLAHAPLQFAENATADQMVPGMLAQDDDDGIQLADPTLDINGDGRTDIAGIAFKFSVWQAGKVLITGRMKFKFLLSLSVQQEDGSYRALAGGPFPMVWKINIRRLRMPSFAELTADFDGDGWIDIMMEKSNKLLITPVTADGIGQKPWKRSIPRRLREPDQVYGRDLDGDGRSSFVVVKFLKEKTLVGMLEHNQ